MNSPSKVRNSIAAIVIGVLIGGGLMAVTPAGAEVAQMAAQNWKKIWKQELQPQADKRYYKKKNADKKFAAKKDTYTKAETYNKTETDAKYQLKGSYATAGSSYTKAESDGKYLPKRALITGPWALGAAPTGAQPLAHINFPAALSAAPTAYHVIAPGAAPPVQCPGTVNAPDAAPGHICVFAAQVVNQNTHYVYNLRPDGAILAAVATANGSYAWGNYAVRPAGYAAAREAVKAELPPLTGSQAGR